MSEYIPMSIKSVRFATSIGLAGLKRIVGRGDWDLGSESDECFCCLHCTPPNSQRRVVLSIQALWPLSCLQYHTTKCTHPLTCWVLPLYFSVLLLLIIAQQLFSRLSSVHIMLFSLLLSSFLNQPQPPSSSNPLAPAQFPAATARALREHR